VTKYVHHNIYVVTHNMHLRMFMVNVPTCTHVIQITVRCQETNSFIQLTMYKKAVLIKRMSLKRQLSALLAPLTVLMSVRHCRDLALHVSRPVAECQISFLGNVYGCLTLKALTKGVHKFLLMNTTTVVYFLGLIG